MSIVCIGKPGVEYDRHAAVYHATAGMEEQLVKRLCFADEVHIWDMSNEFWLGLVYFQAMLDQRTRQTCRIRLMNDAVGRLSNIFELLHNRCLTCGGARRVRHWYAPDELGWKDCPNCVKTFVPPCTSGLGPCNECADAEECKKKRAEHNG
jgi:hypothetical protein